MASFRHAMGLASEEDLKKVKLTYLNNKAQKRKQELKDAIEDNSQDGPFQDIGDHGFQVEHKNGILCNFPVTITKFWGKSPSLQLYPQKSPIHRHLSLEKRSLLDL